MTEAVVLYVGLPGAGKTVLAEKTRREFPQQAIVLDDPSAIQKEDRQNFENTILQCRDHPLVLITDPKLCRADPLAAFAQVREWFDDDVEIAVVLFSDDLEACKANAEYRREFQGDARKITAENIEWFAEGYKYVNWIYACFNHSIPFITTTPYQGHLDALQVS